MNDNTTVGPRLTDLDFFTRCVDASYPGCSTLGDLARRGEVAEARRQFAGIARKSLQPDRFRATLRPGRRENAYTRPGETITDAAERILRHELISCGVPMQFGEQVDWFANPTHNQYREWTWQLSRHWEWELLAEIYEQTRDERYAQGFVRLFKSWVKQAVVPENAPGNATLCWRTIETGIRMGRPWQRVLHAFATSTAFDDDTLVDFYKSVWEHGWRLRNFHYTHNWLIMEMNGLCHIGVIYPMFRESGEWLDYAIRTLVHELSQQVYADGMQFELSTNYHQVNIRNYLLAWHTLEAYGQPVPSEFRQTMERMYDANVRLMMPDGLLPDLNDGIWAKVAPLMTDAVRHFPHRADFCWARTQGAEGSPPRETSVAFDNCGLFALRTSWAPDAVWAFFDGGDFGFAHQHEDKLSVLLHAYGRRLLTDTGNYAYDDSPMRKYVLSTRGHNTIRIDGLDQNRGTAFHKWRNSPRPKDEDRRMLTRRTDAQWRFADGIDVVRADYAEGYGPDAARPVTHRRTLALLKRPPAPLAPCCIVIDDLLPADASSHTYQSLWHTGTNALSIAPGNPLAASSEDAGEANLAIIVADDSDVRLRVVTGQTDPEWQGWVATGQIQGQYQPAPTAEITWTRSGVHRVVTLLHPLAAGTHCPIASISHDAANIHFHLQTGPSIMLPLAPLTL